MGRPETDEVLLLDRYRPRLADSRAYVSVIGPAFGRGDETTFRTQGKEPAAGTPNRLGVGGCDHSARPIGLGVLDSRAHRSAFGWSDVWRCARFG